MSIQMALQQLRDDVQLLSELLDGHSHSGGEVVVYK
jgi:hypothetical protein